MAALPPIEYGMVTHVTCMSEYQDALKAAGDSLVVIDFGAKWCGPCRRIAPFFEELAATHTDVAFLKVDVDEAQDVAQSLSVSALPTFMFLRRGRTIEAFTGADQNKLQSSLDRHKANVAAWAPPSQTAAKPAPKTPSTPAPITAPYAPAAVPSANNSALGGAFHEGDVTSAIATARAQRKPLLVAVESPPPHADSARLESEVWVNADVRTALGHCVALRLRADTQDARNFSALFPVLAFPFIYLINPITGAPFTALPGFTPAATLVSHITTAVATLSPGAPAPAPAPALASAPLAKASPAAPAAPAPVAAEAQQASTATLSLDDAAAVEAEKARLLKKLAEVRAAKEQAAQAEERERELRRLQEAKEAQKAKELSEERRKQIALEKAAREREEDERAKARIREQIRLDRLERTKGSASPAATPVPVAATSPALIASASALAALQVRLLDGSLVKFELPPSAPLSEVRAVLTSKHNQRGAFSLLTPFPRRVYALAEEDRTLAELGLTGAVTLIVTLPDMPAASRAQQPATRAQSQSWGGYLWSWLTWSSPASTPAASHAPMPPMPPAPAAHAPPPGRQVRTLHDQPGNDDDEDRKTWNGNSTQQM